MTRAKDIKDIDVKDRNGDKKATLSFEYSKADGGFVAVKRDCGECDNLNVIFLHRNKKIALNKWNKLSQKSLLKR